MSDWEVKNAWQKGNGDWVLTVGPGMEGGGAGYLFFGAIILTLMITEWIATGSFLSGMIMALGDYVIIMFAIFFHFWGMLMWWGIAFTAWCCAVLETPWIIKIPGIFVFFWALDCMLTLAKSKG